MLSSTKIVGQLRKFRLVMLHNFFKKSRKYEISIVTVKILYKAVLVQSAYESWLHAAKKSVSLGA